MYLYEWVSFFLRMGKCSKNESIIYMFLLTYTIFEHSMKLTPIYCLMLLLSATFGLSSCSNHELSKLPKLIVKHHSYSKPDSIQLTHMDLDLTVSFEKKQLEGKVIVHFKNPYQLPFLILDTRQLAIEKVLLQDSIETSWSLGEDRPVLGQALVIELPKNAKSVAVYYHTTAASEALMWLSPEQTSGKKHPFLFTQSQAVLARTWVPCMDVPAVRYTYSANIHCDPQYMALMSASNPQQKSATGHYHFEMNQPIPSYLMALAVGDIAFKPLGKSCGVYAEVNVLEKAYNEFTDLPKMIDQASELYGPYAWGRYDVLVLPPSFPFGGMENPRLTFATPTIIAGDKSLVSLIAHELAHSWSGNLVTNSNWDDFWLNEGFTVYFEERIMEKIYGKSYSDMLASISFGELQATLKDLMANAPGNTKLKLNLNGRNPDDAVSDIAYIKGSLFLKLLEEKVGRAKWDAFLNKYFNQFKWQSITTENFLDYLQNNLLKAQKDTVNINEWVYQIGLPSNCPKVHSQEFERVEKTALAINNDSSLIRIDTTGFTTHHWLHLFRQLDPSKIVSRMPVFDSLYQLTQSGNAEIQCDWYLLCIQNDYAAAYPAIENYLLHVGRRKFLRPLYDAMIQTPEGLIRAKTIFDKASAAYHAVSRNTIQEMIANAKP